LIAEIVALLMLGSLWASTTNSAVFKVSSTTSVMPLPRVLQIRGSHLSRLNRKGFLLPAKKPARWFEWQPSVVASFGAKIRPQAGRSTMMLGMESPMAGPERLKTISSHVEHAGTSMLVGATR
jgi:hypothetical protein